MLGLTKSYQNATVVKARAMYGRRLTANDYRELVNKRTVAEAAEYLKKNTHFSKALSTINTANVHRGHLEQLIHRYAFERYLGLCDFQQLRKEPFFNFLTINAEIHEILSIILNLNAGTLESYITEMPAYLVKEAKFDLIELAKAKNFKELTDFLKHTQYYSVLKEIPYGEDGKADYLTCEMTMRKYYLSWLTDTIKKDYRGKTRDDLIKQIEIQIDFVNIINAYRMKKFYGLSSDELEKYLLPFYGRMSLKKQKEIFSIDKMNEVVNAFSKTVYGRQMDLSDEERFEIEVEKLGGVAARRALMFSSSAAVSIYSFVLLSDIEVENIIKIIEGIRYQKSPEYMLDQIVSA